MIFNRSKRAPLWERAGAVGLVTDLTTILVACKASAEGSESTYRPDITHNKGLDSDRRRVCVVSEATAMGRSANILKTLNKGLGLL
ncbi:hypothetical protein C8J38_10732 [Rhizobium sp. PP-WC-2G-219]|nr:hypothetical protein C8J38_10732 [Rhizobium sp. PP-WC-2G-219]